MKENIVCSNLIADFILYKISIISLKNLPKNISLKSKFAKDKFVS